ncbi:unnamed protein product [Ectocarpus sp. 4 AP-2014]
MKRRQVYSSAVLIAGYGLLASPSQAFIAPSPCSSSANRHERHRYRVSNANTALSMAWGPAEKAEILSGLIDWQERDVDGVGAADVQILTESSPTAVLTRYYESLAKGEAQQMLLVAPSCTIESGCTTALEAALSSSCISKVYHPDVEQGLGGKAPHLALWHQGVAAEELSPSSDLEQKTASVSKKAVMEEVFLWLQRTMLGMVDDEEEDFVELGRKLLTVHRYVVVKATTEVELSQAFWQEATALAKHGVEAAAEKKKKDAEETTTKKAKQDADEAARVAAAEVEEEEAERPENRDGAKTESLEVTGSTKEKEADTEENKDEDVLKKSGLGGGDDPREASVLMALPGFRFKDRAIFGEFVREKLVAPLRTLSPFGEEGIELSAVIYAGEDLKFPVMIVSPQLKTFEAPEGGYKFIYKGEEKDANEYIRTEELKMAERADERRETVAVEQDPLFGPRYPPPQTPPPLSADEDSN